MAGLVDRGDRGEEPKYGPEHDARILGLLDRKPPPGYANWTGPQLAKALGDIHVQYVWRFLRAQKIDLSGRKSWCESNDPDFVAKAAEIVGLYMARPDGAIVLAVDEKPSIQALERAQGYLTVITDIADYRSLLPSAKHSDGLFDGIPKKHTSEWTSLLGVDQLISPLAALGQLSEFT
jgi:hypothetical protein